jgi:hypothetical protein
MNKLNKRISAKSYEKERRTIRVGGEYGNTIKRWLNKLNFSRRYALFERKQTAVYLLINYLNRYLPRDRLDYVCRLKASDVARGGGVPLTKYRFPEEIPC